MQKNQNWETVSIFLFKIQSLEVSGLKCGCLASASTFYLNIVITVCYLILKILLYKNYLSIQEQVFIYLYEYLHESFLNFSEWEEKKKLLSEMVDAIVSQWMQPEKNGFLSRPS